MRRGIYLACLLLSASYLLAADKLPEGPGLAAKYEADAGIEKNAAVVFAENFEGGDLRRWDDKGGTIAVVDDAPHAGKKCAAAAMHRGKDNGGEAKKWFMPGADCVFARFYVKFSADYQYNHHFVSLMANSAKDKWSSFGKAGLKPDGTYFSSGMEPWFAWGKNPPPGEVNLYTYYFDMAIDKKMNKYWGNGFFPPGPEKGHDAGKERAIPPLDKWQCWEFMVQANTAPEKADGRQAMWIDGKLIADFQGIRFRKDNDLKINCIWLQHYGYDDGDPTKEHRKESQCVWFDDLVVAREYVGPMKEK